ncbi:acyltransferase family protein [Streptomyces canarius]
MTVLVVIHHAVIPYTYYGKADPSTWIGFDGVILATDSFFMALFFFLSGLFVWPSLQRRTPAEFLRERLLRLGLPFAVAALFLMPLAYYAMETGKPGASLVSYWWTTVTAGPWPSGPGRSSGRCWPSICSPPCSIASRRTRRGRSTGSRRSVLHGRRWCSRRSSP